MAAQKSETSWIDAIVSDPAEVPKVIILVGYPGKSSESGYTRLYLQGDLSDYLEIPEDSFLHQEPIPGATPSGLAHVWIKADAELLRGPAPGPIHPSAPTMTARDCQPFTSVCESQFCFAPEAATGLPGCPPPAAQGFPSFYWCPTMPYRGC